MCLVDAKNDVFLRDISIKTLGRHLRGDMGPGVNRAHRGGRQAVLRHRLHDQEDFKQAYPKAASDAGWAADELDATVMTGHGWGLTGLIVCRYWQMQGL